MVRTAALMIAIISLTACGKVASLKREFINAQSAQDYPLQCKIAKEIVELATRAGDMDTRVRYRSEAKLACDIAEAPPIPPNGRYPTP